VPPKLYNCGFYRFYRSQAISYKMAFTICLETE
jgi:hypothetical protein